MTSGGWKAVGAGAIAGIVGLGTFLVIHAVWIVPVWSIAPIGLPLAVAGGAGVGWAWSLLRPRLGDGVRGGLALVGLLALGLVPGGVLGLVLLPETFDEFDTVPGSRVGLYFATFIAFAAAIGALEGWWLVRTRRAAAVTSLASVLFALGLGHNVPVIGSERAGAKMWLIMLVVMVVSALAMVAADGILTRRAASRCPPT